MVVSCFLVCLDVGLVGRVKTNSFPRGHSRPSRLHLLQAFLLIEADPAAGILPLYFILHTSYFTLKVFKLLAQKSTYLTSFLAFLLMDAVFLKKKMKI